MVPVVPVVPVVTTPGAVMTTITTSIFEVALVICNPEADSKLAFSTGSFKIFNDNCYSSGTCCS